MGVKVLILGESGTGKSASLRNFDKDELFLVNVANKPLPFKKKFEVVNSDSYRVIKKAIQETNKKSIVIDDSQYLMANEFMRRASEKGFDKFTEIGQNYWELNQAIDKLPDNVITYVMSHIDRDLNGNEKVKTIGKLLDEKITVEGMYTIVLKTEIVDGKYYFRTQNSGHDTCKSPIGMFASTLIENDLKVVDNAIREYYELTSEAEPVAEEPKVEVVVEDEPKSDRKTRSRRASEPVVEAEVEEPIKKTLAEKMADFQNKIPGAEEEPVRKTRSRRASEPVVEAEVEEPIKRIRKRRGE